LLRGRLASGRGVWWEVKLPHRRIICGHVRLHHVDAHDLRTEPAHCSSE
jgi:hypothetical protein